MVSKTNIIEKIVYVVNLSCKTVFFDNFKMAG